MVRELSRAKLRGHHTGKWTGRCRAAKQSGAEPNRGDVEPPMSIFSFCMAEAARPMWHCPGQGMVKAQV
jgi:hypothetical protein